jgi:fructose-1,6-bisphosphatase I
MAPSIVTIERHLLDQQKLHPHATGAFTNLMYDLALSAKLIARETIRAGLADILGRAGSTNIQGEEQQKLDIYADDVIFKMLDHTERVCILASEEHQEPLPIPDEFPCGHYAVLYDPLDGSSNIDYNVSVGTIFSVHRKISISERGDITDLLQPGYKQVAAGYIVYGSSTMLVYSAGNGVHGFTLDPSIGEFLLSHPNIRIPSQPMYYSVNYGYDHYWREGVKRYMHWLTGNADDGPKGLSLRYIGSLVADFHRNLLSGGLFMYPADLKDPKQPYGKLRVTYEAAPLAFIAEKAGGYASDGVNAISRIQPHSLHQRTPLFIGNRELVEKAEYFIGTYDQGWVESYQAHLRELEEQATV